MLILINRNISHEKQTTAAFQLHFFMGRDNAKRVTPQTTLVPESPSTAAKLANIEK
jgi:hypothetical protein